RSEVDAGRQRSCRALLVHGHVQSRTAKRLQERIELRKSRRRLGWRHRVSGLAQQTDRGPQVVEGVARRLDEVIQVLTGLVWVRVVNECGNGGLGAGEGDLVGDEIV